MELSNPSQLSSLLSRHGFSFSKGLGQNFLINPTVCPRMADGCGAGETDGVLEIGPGIGVLTKELALRCRKVVSVELDTRLFPILGETLAEFDNVKIVHGDVMKVDLRSLIAEEFADCERVFVCANLPYYITSPVLMRLLEERLPVEGVTVMVQKEAADRLCAAVGSREAGAVTVAVSYYTSPHILFPVGRGSFMPPPNVDSSVIRLDVRKDIATDEAYEKRFFACVRGGFNQRRKTLQNALSAAGYGKANVAEALRLSGLPATARGEALSMEDWHTFVTNLAKTVD